MAGSHKQPIVIAHRGASAYLPEHSLAAKALAAGFDADYLEQDVVASRDGQLLVLHDLWLDEVSDVAKRFPGRQRDDGRYYCIDFDLAEIRTLSFGERIDPATGKEKYPGRFKRAGGSFAVVTLKEELRFVAALNASSGRNYGIYPEIKNPGWHAGQGIDLTGAVIDLLDQFGYLSDGLRIYLQCYDAETLKAVRARVGPDLPIIQLVSSATPLDPTTLADIATYATGIGPSLKLIWRGVSKTGEPELSNLVTEAQAMDLEVHPYTFRADDLPCGCTDFDSLLDTFIGQLGVDGVFTDFPDLVKARLKQR